MRGITFVVERDEDGGFRARARRGDLTEGGTLAAVRENVRDAVRCHFEDDERPATIRLRFADGETFSV